MAKKKHASGEVLTKIEIHYIKTNPDNLSIKELAAELGRSLPSIRKVLKEAKVTEIPTIVEVTPIVEPANQNIDSNNININSLMGKRTRNNVHVATVMTPTAAEASDEARKFNLSNNRNELLQKSVHKPRG